MLPYIMSGHTYADIAKSLFVTEKTVSVHAATMLRKTGTANRVELAQLAQRRRSNARREPSRSEHG
jgi:DNA-binding NarL/FixJ family response regulator